MLRPCVCVYVCVVCVPRTASPRPPLAPACSQSPDPAQHVDALGGYRKRLIYRSKQRGWLEVDLIMGSFATEAVPGMTEAELHAYERILNSETLDLYNYVSGKDAVPAELEGPVMDQLRAFVDSRPIMTPEAYKKVKGVMSN